MTRPTTTSKVIPPQRKTRARAQVVEPEQSEAAAGKQASQALARLKVAEAERTAKTKADERAARAKRAREAGNQRARTSTKVGTTATKAPAPKAVPHPEERPFDLSAAIRSLQPEFVQCRDWGHSWRPFTARWISRMNHYESILRCARCETERVRFIGPNGEIFGSKYDYQDGYQMRGSGVLSTSDRDQIRLASIRIIEVKDTVQE